MTRSPRASVLIRQPPASAPRATVLGDDAKQLQGDTQRLLRPYRQVVLHFAH